MYKVIIVGLGSISDKWIDACEKNEEIEIVAYVSKTYESLNKFQKKNEIGNKKLFNSFDKALNLTKFDFIINITPPEVHFEIAKKTLNFKKNLITEKPISDSYNKALNIVKEGEINKCIHMISQQRRFAPLVRETRKLIVNNDIGKVKQIDIFFFVAWADIPDSHYVKNPYMFLLDMGCHHFDFVRYLIGSEPISVNTLSWNLPWGWHTGDASHIALFEFESGIRFIHRAMGCSKGKPTSWFGDCRIEGELGTIIWKDEKLFLTSFHKKNKPIEKKINFSIDKSKNEFSVILDTFLRSVKNNKEPECSAKDNLNTLAMTLSAVKSAQQNKKILIDEIKINHA